MAVANDVRNWSVTVDVQLFESMDSFEFGCSVRSVEIGQFVVLQRRRWLPNREIALTQIPTPVGSVNISTRLVFCCSSLHLRSFVYVFVRFRHVRRVCEHTECISFEWTFVTRHKRLRILPCFFLYFIYCSHVAHNQKLVVATFMWIVHFLSRFFFHFFFVVELCLRLSFPAWKLLDVSSFLFRIMQ